MPDVSIIQAQVDSLWARYKAAALAEDVDAPARIHTDSAYLVEPGRPTIRGNAAIHSLVKRFWPRYVSSSPTFVPSLPKCSATALQIGEYRDVLQPTDQPVQTAFGRFAAVLRRNDAGTWRVDRLIAFPDSTVMQLAETTRP